MSNFSTEGYSGDNSGSQARQMVSVEFLSIDEASAIILTWNNFLGQAQNGIYALLSP